jgi:hypothetical protein
LLARAREAVRGVSISGPEERRDAVLGHLADGGLVAAAQRDVELARLIGKAVVSGAQVATSEPQVATLLRCLLAAGGAFEDEREWAEWIEEQLTQIALSLPRGEPARAFLTHIAELKRAVDLSLCIHGRAEALASVAN